MELVWKALIGEGQGEGDRTDKRDEVSEGLDEGVKNRQESSSSNLGRFRCQQLLLRAMLQARCTASSSSSSSSSSNEHLNDHDDAMMMFDDEANVMHMVNSTYQPSMAFAISTPVSEGDQLLSLSRRTNYICFLVSMISACNSLATLAFHPHRHPHPHTNPFLPCVVTSRYHRCDDQNDYPVSLCPQPSN